MQQGGSQCGVSPEMVSCGPSHTLAKLQEQHLLQQQEKPGDAATVFAEAASPISSRPPAWVNFEELAPSVGGLPDEDGLVGEDVERGATSGNRWPRQETLALLKIRSEMDAVFREATLKGPLWEDVSRRIAELGYSRSAKKCKEKFENVHKYYKRTKEGRAGRQDGRNYRFFSELEALNNSSTANTTTIAATTTPAIPVSAAVGGGINPIVGSSSSAGIIRSPAMVSAAAVTATQRPDLATSTPAANISGSAAATAAISFSSDTSSLPGSEEDEIEEGLNMDTRKRKETQLGGGRSKKMMAFFERLIKNVMEKQEGMMQRFLEAIEKREQDRMTREEAWRLQEMARLTREQEMMARERAITASRDAAVIAVLQQITGQTVQIITPVTVPAPAPPMQPNRTPAPPQFQHQQQQQQQQQYRQRQQQQQQQSQVIELMGHQAQSSEVMLVQREQPEATGLSSDSTSSRWPKAEVLSLIKLRTSLEAKYQESGPKGPLWEDISTGMQRLGYKRSAKRCKEKWENINKYFKKVKESKKKRPEDAKTCPYFHELDALYRNKLPKSSSISHCTKQEQEVNPDPCTKQQETHNVMAILPSPQSATATEIKTNNNNKNGGNSDVGRGFLLIQTDNGGLPPNFFDEGSAKKPEDIVKELMAGRNQQKQNKLNQHHHSQQQAMMEYDNLDDGEDLDQDDEDESNDEDEDGDEAEDDDDEGGKMAYKIEYQRPNQVPSKAQGNASGSLAMV